MKTRKKIVNVDFHIQRFLFAICAVLGAATFLTEGAAILLFGFLLFFLGIWQVLSALILGMMLSDRKRGKYLLFSLCYLGIVGLSAVIIEYFGGPNSNILGIIFIGIVPFALSFYYLRLTKHSLKELEHLGKVVKMPKQLDDILDSEEIFKPIEKL